MENITLHQDDSQVEKLATNAIPHPKFRIGDIVVREKISKGIVTYLGVFTVQAISYVQADADSKGYWNIKGTLSDVYFKDFYDGYRLATPEEIMYYTNKLEL